MKENGIEAEKELEVNVIEKQSAPVPEHSYNAEDWISDVKVMGEVCLISAYDGTLALWDAAEEEILFQVSVSNFKIFFKINKKIRNKCYRLYAVGTHRKRTR